MIGYVAKDKDGEIYIYTIDIILQYHFLFKQNKIIYFDIY